jgi:tRNA (guanine37-N1)-methyltransferase
MSQQSKSHGRKSISANLQPRALMTPSPQLAGVWTAQILTLFPEAFPGVLGESLTGRALKDGKWALDTIDLRLFGEGKHRNVDDTPAGGGAGMVLKPNVVGAALDRAMAQQKTPLPMVCLSPRGTPFTQAKARAWANAGGVTMLCGRFEGIDQRVIDHYQLEEVSLGDFVLTGGEIAAQAMIDATVRLLPDILGNEASIAEESHMAGLLEHPHYTRPALWNGRPIPDVLQSGHHINIAKWRQEMSQQVTKEKRPDLWAAFQNALGKPDPKD